MKKLLIAAGLILSATFSFGSEVERLVDKLVEKGILTESEAYKIVAEAEEEAKKQEAVAKTDSDRISGWIKNTKFKGDVRLRYEKHGRENQDGSSIADRHRTRVRFRWGFDTKVNDRIEAGLRIATGDSTQGSSANQTFTGAFNDKEIWLDRAYVKYSPAAMKNLSFTGGKIANPFYNTNLVWSGDINPEGFISQLNLPVGNNSLFATAGYFPVYEAKDRWEDPYMLGFQVGYDGKIAEKKFKTAAAYYHYSGLKGAKAADVSPGFNNQGNTLSGGNYVYDYHLFNVNAEFTPFEIPFMETKLPVRFYADYVKNRAEDVKDKEGYLFGVKVGSAKNKNTWEIGYDYRRLEADAITEFMADGSFSQGGTDCKGHTYGFKYAVSDNSTLGISYMATEGLGNRKRVDVNTIQIDYVVAF